MKRFLYKFLTLISVGFLILAVLLLITRENHRFIPNDMYYYDDFNTAFEEGNLDVLTLGNSRLLAAIDKNTLSEDGKHLVGNLGYSSSNISVSKLILESYLENCEALPNTVLLEVSWFTFNTERTHLHAVVGDLFIKEPMLWKNFLNYKSEDLLPKIRKAFGKSLSRALGTLKTYKKITYDERVHASQPNTKSYTFDISEMEVVFPDHVAGIDEQLYEDFTEIVNMCDENDIQLILFTAPEDKAYTDAQKDLEPIKNIYRTYAEENSNIYYLDYSFGGDLYDKKYEYWLSNSHHINERELFTKQLLSDLKGRTKGNVFLK